MALKIHTGALSAMAILAAAFASVPEKPAQAQGFFEQIFGPPTYRERSYRERDYRERRRSREYRFRRSSRRDNQGRWGLDGFQYERPVYDYERRRRPDYDRPVEDAYVKPPRYFTYRPDVLRTIAFSSLAEVDTASTGPLDAITPERPSPFSEARVHLAGYKLRLLAEVGDAVKAYYKAHPDFVWVYEGEVTGKARAAIAVLEDAGRFGLAAADYAIRAPFTDIMDGEERKEALIQFDLALTSKVMTYVLDATRGRIDPNRISEYHDFKRKSVDLVEVMERVAASGNVSAYLESHNPQNSAFKALAGELATLRASAEGKRVEIAAGTFVRPGGSSPELVNVIEAIKLSGSDALKAEHAETLSGYFGGEKYTKELVALVRGFQKENGLHPDGIVGKNTIGAMMQDSKAEKIRKIELAMERLRWLPGDLGARHVFINQPAYTATYVQDYKSNLVTRAVVGKKSNQTYFFMDKVEVVEFNPYWGVPRSIIVNEMLPKLYRDPSYLDRLGYEVSTVSGQRVSSWDVDWGAVAANKASINVRQPPGRGNALGLVKILFPNKHHIYMHDTPHKNLFAKDKRAFSHGCVRLQDPRKMAAAVLGKPVSYVDRRIAEGQNDQDQVKADIPVYVAYFTAWPSDDGAVQFYDDVYDRDDYLSKAITRTKAARASS